MPTFYDSRNQPHVLTERVGSGGEGTVYACEDSSIVAKIYHEPITEEKAEKLRWMAANKNEQLLKVAAWVIDILTDAPDGKIVGFLMPNVKAKEIHELYSLKSRRVYFPEATWHFLVHTAANLARAFHNLHQNAHVMGDINHGNCVVLADGTVKLIDCDSYSIKTEKMRYPCEVGVATHLAPELQGVNLRAAKRTEKHDNFGLAVIIFQLLFLGRHPFAGNYPGSEDKPLEDCIREHLFAYGKNAAIKNVRQPPGTLALAAVSPRVAVLFERAFLTEERPAPHEWVEALEDLAHNLEQCRLHPGHLYFAELVACPWCEIESQTGLMLFPFVTSGSRQNGEKPFDVFTVENLIASLGISNNPPARQPKPAGNRRHRAFSRACFSDERFRRRRDRFRRYLVDGYNNASSEHFRQASAPRTERAFDRRPAKMAGKRTGMDTHERPADVERRFNANQAKGSRLSGNSAAKRQSNENFSGGCLAPSALQISALQINRRSGNLRRQRPAAENFGRKQHKNGG